MDTHHCDSALFFVNYYSTIKEANITKTLYAQLKLQCGKFTNKYTVNYFTLLQSQKNVTLHRMLSFL